MKEEKTSWTQEERKILLNFGRGAAAYQLKKYDIAKVVFENVIEMDSNHYKSHLFLAKIYLKENDREKVLFHLEKAVSIDEDCKQLILELRTFEAFFGDEGFIRITK